MRQPLFDSTPRILYISTFIDHPSISYSNFDYSVYEVLYLTYYNRFYIHIQFSFSCFSGLYSSFIPFTLIFLGCFFSLLTDHSIFCLSFLLTCSLLKILFYTYYKRSKKRLYNFDEKFLRFGPVSETLK